ncbi:hypothetical protein D3C78_1520180 [compost metagenome]
MFLVGDEQQRCQLIEQLTDRADFHRQLDGGRQVGLQGQIMLTVEIRHSRAGEAQAYQGVGQRFDQVATRDDPIIFNDPGRSYDHGQLRVEIEVGIQRPERGAQRFRRNFSQ